jgi:DNA-binding PadR family transcriptional regulator
MDRLGMNHYLVLQHLAEVGETYGLELAKGVGLHSGTAYPLLARLEERGLIVGRWEEIDEHAAGRRRRRYWRITDQGRSAMTATAARLRLSQMVEDGRTSGLPGY